MTRQYIKGLPKRSRCPRKTSGKAFGFFLVICMVGERDWCMKWGLLVACCVNMPPHPVVKFLQMSKGTFIQLWKGLNIFLKLSHSKNINQFSHLTFLPEFWFMFFGARGSKTIIRRFLVSAVWPIFHHLPSPICSHWAPKRCKMGKIWKYIYSLTYLHIPLHRFLWVFIHWQLPIWILNFPGLSPLTRGWGEKFPYGGWLEFDLRRLFRFKSSRLWLWNWLRFRSGAMAGVAFHDWGCTLGPGCFFSVLGVDSPTVGNPAVDGSSMQPTTWDV